MSIGYRVQTVVFASGERFPLLMEAGTGLPLFDATVFLLTQLRATNRASSTLEQAARAVMVLHQILDFLLIDLAARFSHGQVLQMSEVEAICRLCRLQQSALDEMVCSDSRRPQRGSVHSLEQVRMAVGSASNGKDVSAQTAAIRLIYIRDYIRWLANRSLLARDARNANREHWSATASVMLEAISARIPGSSGRNVVGLRQGILSSELDRLVEVTHPDSPENPWKGAHVRRRNRLIILCLLQLGLRKSELLGLRLSDINFQSNEVLVARRPDDPVDPRVKEPNAKTRDRLLHLSDELAELTREYVMTDRKSLPGARRHPFLIVAIRTGHPLTKVAVNKLFVELRSKVTGLPEQLSPHVLRHTWNDQFSELMDEKGVAPELEEQLRSQQMGWKNGSKTAATYTRRHVDRKAREASLHLQERIQNRKSNGQG